MPLSLGFSGFRFLWVRLHVFRVSLGTSVKSSSAFRILKYIYSMITVICTAKRERERERDQKRQERAKAKEKEKNEVRKVE